MQFTTRNAESMPADQSTQERTQVNLIYCWRHSHRVQSSHCEHKDLIWGEVRFLCIYCEVLGPEIQQSSCHLLWRVLFHHSVIELGIENHMMPSQKHENCFHVVGENSYIHGQVSVIVLTNINRRSMFKIFCGPI